MRFFPTRLLWAAAVALGLAGLFDPPARAHHWQLESATLPAPFLRNGRVDLAIEPSGIAPIGDGRRILVPHDTTASLQVVDVATGTLVGEPLDSSSFFPATGNGTTWAGMTHDSEGNYYLVSSGIGKNDAERAAGSALVRFRLRGGENPVIDNASVVRWDIARPLEAGLRPQRLDPTRIAQQRVGGLAIREIGGHRQLVVGLAHQTTRSAPSSPTSPPRRRPAPRSNSAPCSRSTPAAARASPRRSRRSRTSPR